MAKKSCETIFTFIFTVNLFYQDINNPNLLLKIYSSRNPYLRILLKKYPVIIQKVSYINFCLKTLEIITKISFTEYLVKIFITMDKTNDTNIYFTNSSLVKYVSPNIDQIRHTCTNIILFVVKIHLFFKYFLNNLIIILGCHLFFDKIFNLYFFKVDLQAQFVMNTTFFSKIA